MAAATPKKKPHWLWRLLRDCLLILVVCSVILGIAIFRKPSQRAMLYYQYRAMQGAGATAGQPAFWTTGLSRALTIASMKNFGDDNDDDNATPGSTDDKCTPLPAHLVPPGGIGDPDPLARLNAYMEYVLPDAMQIVFCHALTASDGTRRLVVVAVGPERFARTLLPPLAWEAVIIDPAGWTSSPTCIGRQRGRIQADWANATPTTFLTGHDQSDSFVIPFQSATHTATLHGQLQPGGRKLTVSEN